MLSIFWNMENWSILVFLDCRSHVRYIFSWTIDKWIILHVIHWSIWDFSDWIKHFQSNSMLTAIDMIQLWDKCYEDLRMDSTVLWSVSMFLIYESLKKSFKWVQSAHCHVYAAIPYLLSSWHPIVLASQLFHSCIVSARRTLFEPPLTLSHWHWPRVWDQPTLRDFSDCLHAYIATVRAMWQTWYLSKSLH